MRNLFDLRMADGSRHFGDLPETTGGRRGQWHDLREHVARLPGAALTGFLTDDVTEAFVDFTCRGAEFTLNNQHGMWWFFVADPATPDALLHEVLDHFAVLLDPAARVRPDASS